MKLFSVWPSSIGQKKLSPCLAKFDWTKIYLSVWPSLIGQKLNFPVWPSSTGRSSSVFQGKKSGEMGP